MIEKIREMKKTDLSQAIILTELVSMNEDEDLDALCEQILEIAKRIRNKGGRNE